MLWSGRDKLKEKPKRRVDYRAGEYSTGSELICSGHL